LRQQIGELVSEPKDELSRLIRSIVGCLVKATYRPGEARDGPTSTESVALQKHNPGTVTCRSDSRSHAGSATTDDKNVGFEIEGRTTVHHFGESS
jgi:hypothetical protein